MNNTREYLSKGTSLFMFVVAIISLQACNSDNVKLTASKNDDTTVNTLIGKQGRITYPDFTAEVQYLTDSTLHWKTIDKKGKVVEETEHVSHQQLNSHQYFLNWIEKDGLTVSQVIDTRNKKVTAYLSYKDEKSLSGRAAQFLKGTFEFINHKTVK